MFTDTEGLLYHFLIEGNMVKDGSKIPPDVRKTRRCVHVCSSGEPLFHTHVQSADCCFIWEIVSIFHKFKCDFAMFITGGAVPGVL